MQNPVAAVLPHPHCIQIDMTIRRGGTTRPDNLRHAEPRSCRVVSPPHCVQIDMTICRGGTTRPNNLRHAEPRSRRVVSPSLRSD